MVFVYSENTNSHSQNGMLIQQDFITRVICEYSVALYNRSWTSLNNISEMCLSNTISNFRQ